MVATDATTVGEPEGSVIWILGLMHSGTTVFWRAWRADPRFRCFDEPMSGLGTLPNQNDRNSYDEFIGLMRDNPRRFWSLYAPLHPLEELDGDFTVAQTDYIKFLLTQSPNVVMDETHLHLHARALAEVTPHANVIHLFRGASAFATSHLRPSWPRGKTLLRRAVRTMRHAYNEHSFWSRYDFPPGLRREEVIGAHPHSKFGLLLEDAGYDADRIMRSSALVRLLAYWHYHYHYLTREGARVFGTRFRNVAYEAFAREPDGTMRELYEWIGLPLPDGASYAEVHPPKPAYRASDRRWREAAVIAGFSEDEIRTLL